MSKEMTVDPIKVQVLYTDGNVPGYPALVPIRGLPIYNHFLKLENSNPREIWVRPHHRIDLPQYQPVAKRMPGEASGRPGESRRDQRARTEGANHPHARIAPVILYDPRGV